jgi:hypothetical protein
MAFLSFEQVASDGTVKTVTSLTVPANATLAMLQASGNDVRYTMDGATNPTNASGMILQNGLTPEQFLIEDVNNIRFTQDAAGAGFVNIHYLAGRDV